jgi:hypothetical protein
MPAPNPPLCPPDPLPWSPAIILSMPMNGRPVSLPFRVVEAIMHSSDRVEFVVVLFADTRSPPAMAGKAVTSSRVKAMIFLSIFFCLLFIKDLENRLLDDFSEFIQRVPQVLPKL